MLRFEKRIRSENLFKKLSMSALQKDCFNDFQTSIGSTDINSLFGVPSFDGARNSRVYDFCLWYSQKAY